MPISRTPTQQSLARLAVRLRELEAWRDREFLSISEARFRIQPNESWQPIRQGDYWPAKGHPVYFQFHCKIPESWTGYPVNARFDLDGEALLSVNGHSIGGLNPFHREHQIIEKATGGEEILFEAEAVPHGLFGTPTPEPRFNLAALVVPDRDVQTLFEDLLAAHDAAKYLVSINREEIAEHLIEALHQAVATVNLERGNTDSYLARIAFVSQSRSPQDYYGNEESLASIWEEWKFTAPLAPLPDSARHQINIAREEFRKEINRIRERYPSSGSVWLTGHAHIDLAWLWPVEETRRKIRRTFYTLSALMERYPKLYFNQSSAQVYAWIEKDDPALFERIRAKVKEGRWEIIGGMWVEPDGNLPTGESWVRQLLFGQRFFESRFNLRPRVAWIPDSFGFTGNMPQLLLSAGIQYFFTHKLTWNERNPFPYDLYWWEGLDGSRVLAHSFFNPAHGYNGHICAFDVAETWRGFSSKTQHDSTLLAFGYGDGGGGPSSNMLERFERLQNFPGMPRLRMGRVEEFYDQISTNRLPVWVGEKYLEYHRATYTTQSEIKSLHRQLEQAMTDLETAATLALHHAQQAYDTDSFAQLWQILLLNEFHDILPGSSIHSVYETAKKELTSGLQTARSLRESTLELLSNEAKSLAEEGVTFWNLQLYDRPLRAELSRLPESATRFLTVENEEVASQRTCDNTLLLSAPNIIVPALGNLSIREINQPPGKPLFSLVGTDSEIENEFLKVIVDGDGTISSIYDKEHEREVLADRANQLWLYTDIPRQFDAWDIDSSYVTEGIELKAADNPISIESGPIRSAIRVTRRVDETVIIQDYRLYQGERLLEIRTKINWHGRRKLLRALFPVNIRTDQGWTETAFGAVSRPTHRNTPWDQARFEVPGHRWADLSEPSYGVSVLTDSKYGYSFQGNVLGLSLLRSSIYPDPFADEGDHQFAYGLYPHSGDWRNSTVRMARNFNSSLHAVPFAIESKDQSFAPPIRLISGRLELSAFKRTEDSNELILRLYEPHGDRCTANLETTSALRKVVLTNLLEEPIQELSSGADNRIQISFTPFQVQTLKLTFS
jgi:alpha-mannosidase